MACPRSRDLSVLGAAALAIALICGGSGCSGKDPYRPGDPLGAFHVTGSLVSNSCGNTPNPWQFDVHLRHDKTTLYWVQGAAPIAGLVDATARATLKATAVQTMRAADAKTQAPGCAIARADVLEVVLAPVVTPVADVTGATSFKGSLTYHFAVTDGSDCQDQLADSGGDFTALPCDVHYDLVGTRTGDAP
jgi:hypothetical protein